MSIYDRLIEDDVDEIFSDDEGFWREHDVNGYTLRAIVHASSLSTRSALLDLGTFGADRVCIVRAADYPPGVPVVDSVFFLDGDEFRVSAASILGGLCIKISLHANCD